MREITCIACPIGCRLEVEQRPDGSISVAKNSCARGVTYGRQEYAAPVRMVTSSVRVLGGEEPLASVRTAEPIPKEAIARSLAEIRALRAQAPLRIGQVLEGNLAGTGIALIVTREVDKAS